MIKNMIKGICLVGVLFLSTQSYGGTVTQFVPKEPTEPMTFETGKAYTATIATSKGEIEVELYPDKAPLSVTNFVQLVNGGFYEGLTFHRVVPGFVVQGGDPKGDGTGGPGYTVGAELKTGLSHVEGALAWARLGGPANPEKKSSGSQFYITLASTHHLDGDYTVFGKTTKGMDIVKKLAIGDTIQKVTLNVK